MRNNLPAYLFPYDSRFPMHLQWFAAEDEGRTEEPTEYKIRKAREEGKVAKSADVTSAIVLLFGIIALWFFGQFIFETVLEMMRYFIGHAGEIDITTDRSVVPVFVTFLVKLMLPITAVTFAAALLGNILQVGFLFTTKTIAPDLKKIAPNFARFFKRALFSSEAGFNFLKSIVKVVLIAVIAFLNIRARIDRIISLVGQPFTVSVGFLAATAFTIMAESAVVMLVFSLADYVFQRRQHIEYLKMSKPEIKEERKMLDGDPLIRSRLRERMRQLLTRNMIQNVPRADVVITNPTHFAVAMEYKKEKMPAPVLLAKGQDNLAFRIKAIALEHSIPVIENKPLARALYNEVEIGDPIPEKYYEVVALILSEVYRMTGRVMEAV